MKKIYILLFTFAALLTVSCGKEQKSVVDSQTPEENLVYKTFTVTMPDSPVDPASKTYLHSDGHAVYWSADDEIAVIEVANQVKRTFTLKTGAGTSTAVFEGSVSEDATGYYAYYPNVAIKTASLPTYIEPNSGLPSIQRPVVGGYDKNFAVMTAVADGDGSFTFRHGAAFFKITIPRDDITSVKLTTASSRFNGRPQFEASTGVNKAINSSSSDMILAPESGTLTKDATYYIPVLYKDSNTGNLTLEYTFTGGAIASKTSTSLSKVKLAAGKIYNLGSPVIIPNPQFSADDLEIDGDDKSGSITYSVLYPYDGGGVVTAEVTASEPSGWLSLGVVGATSVPFTCSTNDYGSNRTATVQLTYTYDTDKTATKSVNVVQTVPGSFAYSWDFSTSAWQAQLASQASDACAETNSNTNVTFTFSYDGLSYTSGSGNGKWSTSGYVQPNGAGDTGKRYFSFTSPKSGTITVTVSNPKSSENESSTRAVAVKVGSEDPETSAVVLYTGGTVTRDFTIGAGEVKIYPAGNGLRFYKIEYASD